MGRWTALLFACGLLSLPLAHAGLAVGDRFPSLTDGAIHLEGAGAPAAGSVMLIDFWASWCQPCKASFPAYAALEQEYRPRGLSVVAISVDRDPAAYEAFLRRMRPPFATLRDRDQLLVRRVDVPVMPTCFLVGRDGRVRFLHAGYHGAETDRALRREIDTLLAEKNH